MDTTAYANRHLLARRDVANGETDAGGTNVPRDLRKKNDRPRAEPARLDRGWTVAATPEALHAIPPATHAFIDVDAVVPTFDVKSKDISARSCVPRICIACRLCALSSLVRLSIAIFQRSGYSVDADGGSDRCA